ncbi:TRADD-N-associated membrane domain-containing protein [Amycolatopsis sp. NPDC004368]
MTTEDLDSSSETVRQDLDLDEQHDWYQSTERRNLHRTRWISPIAFIVTNLLVLLLGSIPSTGKWFFDASTSGQFYATEAFIIWFIISGGTLSAILFFSNIFLRREFKIRRDISSRKKLLAQREAESLTLDLNSLWQLTQERLDLYHDIATGQAERSYRNSRAASIVGFTIIAIAIVASGISNSLGGALTVGIIGVAGGALAGYVSRTFLKMHETSTQHLSSYFDQPLLFSQLLAAERLLNMLDGELRAEAVREIIRGISGCKEPEAK